MTPNQARRAARSLNYRRRLNEKVPELEAKLADFLRERKADGRVSALLGTYKVTLNEGELTIEEVDPIDPNQLTFKFIEEEKNEDRNSRESKASQFQR
ncbi:MAG: hypothetical protein V5A79_05870 [Candidatus Bipolaricaulota bacterium]